MKKNIKYTALMALMVLLMTTGCKKLTETPISFIPPANFYTTPTQVEAAYIAAMNRLWNEWEGYSDGAGSGIFVNDDQYYGGDLVISESQGDLAWRVHYAALLNINAAISALKSGKLDEVADQETVDQLMGQGKLLRAYSYFMLVRLFGDIPLITEDTPDPVVNDLERSSISDVYTVIENDLLEAVDKLPASWANGPGKPTKYAAQALLAKAYLTMATAPLNQTANYAKAAAQAWDLIQSHAHSLVTNVGDLFLQNNKYNSEMIWSFNSNDVDRATDPHAWGPDFLGGWSGGAVEPGFEQAFPNQPRKDAFLFYKYNGLPYTDPSWSPDNFPFIQKFLNVSDADFDGGRSVLNLPIIRYADVLLIYAEAKNMANGGPTQDAVDAINEVIERANGYLPNPDHPALTIVMGKDDFDKAVIAERSLELCFEMDRWFDIVRKRILPEVTLPEYIQNFSEDDYLMPIPQQDLRLNKRLTQNPGYSTPD